jgi:hypothetical protein
MINGGNGTFNEVSTAYLWRKPIIVFEGSGGWADKIKEIALEGKYLDERKNIELKYANSPSKIVDLAFKYAIKEEDESDKNKVS